MRFCDYKVLRILPVRILAMFTNPKKDQMVGDDIKMVLLLDGRKEFLHFLVTDGRNVPTFLANEMVMQTIR